MDVPHADQVQGRSGVMADGGRLLREAQLMEELRQAQEALAALRAQFVDAARQFQKEIAAVGESLQAHQHRVGEVERRLADVTTSAEAAALGRQRAEQELARMRATLTWRLRNRLLRLAPVHSVFRLVAQARRLSLRPAR